MNAIRIRRRIDGETLHLPELRPLVGKEVDIVVIDPAAASQAEGAQLPLSADEFWNPPTLEELARRQGIDLNQPTPPPRHEWSDADFEGFEDAVNEWRGEAGGGRR